MSPDKHDTTPPPEGPPTNPTLPGIETIAPIEAGKAALTVTGAFLDLLTAVNRAQAVADAIARALDATAK